MPEGFKCFVNSFDITREKHEEFSVDWQGVMTAAVMRPKDRGYTIVNNRQGKQILCSYLHVTDRHRVVSCLYEEGLHQHLTTPT